MDAAKFCLFLMIATLLAVAGCSDSSKKAAPPKKTTVLYGDEYMTAEDGTAEAVLIVEK